MNKNTKLIRKLIIGIILCAVLIGMLTLYARMLQRELDGETVDTLQEVAEQNVVVVKKELEKEFGLLTEIADRISVEEAFDPQQAVDELCGIQKRYSFKRMGVILPDGSACTTDRRDLFLGDREFFRESMQGKAALSDRLQDKINGEEIFVFSMPVYAGDRVCAVLFATYRVESLQELLAVSVFGGNGYSYIISGNGDAVVNTVSPTGFVDFRNVYRSLTDVSKENRRCAEELRQGIESGREGYIEFYNKESKYMFYSSLGVKDWYMLNVVPAGVMDSTRDVIMGITWLLCIALIILFLIFTGYIFRIERQKKKELADVLYVDSVTGGYSYARFCVEAKECLGRMTSAAAYIVMDIDNFKVINELFGYEEGDKTLRYVWDVWKRCSGENEIFARRIADSFVALWHFHVRQELNDRLDGFIEKLQSNLQESSSDYNLKCTMGVYIVKDKTEDVQNMMNYAVMAHASIKGQADRWYTFYDDEFREMLLRNKIMEDQMKRALKRQEFAVYYQPKYNTDTKELMGAEALVRWIRGDRSAIMPNEFIPLAEKNGFISQLDKHVFTEVCIRQKKWLDEGKRIVPVSVNLSRRHLYNEEFVEEYREVVEETGLPPEYIQLELTESAIFENQEALCQIIDRLHLMGFRILMDDFGTGYSSLMMLKSLPIDILKLDKSFVDDFDDPRGEKIITSVIGLAQSLQMEVTAEGVETEAQYRFLKELGCSSIQGFYFAKPMPAAEYECILDASGKERPSAPPGQPNTDTPVHPGFTTASRSYTEMR